MEDYKHIQVENPPKSQNRIVFLLWLACLTSSLSGVQFVYSIQFALGTPLFVDALKLTETASSYVMATAGKRRKMRH